MGKIRSRAREVLERGLGRLLNRHAILLPRPAGGKLGILPVRAPYRVEGDELSISVLETRPGEIAGTLLGYQGHFPTLPLWSGPRRPFAGRAQIRFDLARGAITLDGEPWGETAKVPERRFAFHLQVVGPGQAQSERLLGHYRPLDTRVPDAAYYHGLNYVDHAAESAAEADAILALMDRHRTRGPVLEVGCATGEVLLRLQAAGYEVHGVDFSSFAVETARQRFDPTRVHCSDVESEGLPAEIRGPFGVLLLWAVLEHFRRPFEVLRRLGDVVRPGGHLLVNTTNAGSLTRFLFGRDWEGHFDPTHHGVEDVSVATLRQRLPSLGWDIVFLETDRPWTTSADPTHATLRDWYAADARFRRLLRERDAGDYVTLVARRVG